MRYVENGRPFPVCVFRWSRHHAAMNSSQREGQFPFANACLAVPGSKQPTQRAGGPSAGISTLCTRGLGCGTSWRGHSCLPCRHSCRHTAIAALKPLLGEKWGSQRAPKRRQGLEGAFAAGVCDSSIFPGSRLTPPYAPQERGRGNLKGRATNTLAHYHPDIPPRPAAQM